MKMVYRIALILTIIGAINWGTIGIFNFNFVAEILSAKITNIVYIIVGVSGVLTAARFNA